MAARWFLNPERIDSLLTRLRQEELFGARAFERPLLGWGGYDRNWPVDPNTGQNLIAMIDALWIILFSQRGFLGLSSVFLGLGIGPWKILTYFRKKAMREEIRSTPGAIDAIILGLAVTCFLLDCLMNGHVAPIYIMCSGALVSYYLRLQSRIPYPSASIALV